MSPPPQKPLDPTLHSLPLFVKGLPSTTITVASRINPSTRKTDKLSPLEGLVHDLLDLGAIGPLHREDHLNVICAMDVIILATTVLTSSLFTHFVQGNVRIS